MRNARSTLSALAALLLTAAALSTAAPSASAANNLDIRIDRIDVIAHIPHDLADGLFHTELGASETLTGTVLDGGVDVGEGVAHETGNGGTESLNIPLTLDLGVVNSGDHPVVVATDTQLDATAETVTRTFTFTCHLNALGTGTCS
ncbi:hypothetical protein [Streptomyces violascens]|uniref:Uncharacterized protein n=1 Tax=Streptomyces violascens TaxID=67381 RepID=A0ABQ3QSM1_9ACTN|nr:hypothetical protein [Streptomyces violascens]GGU33458.1 hypothetical protein GCM10010289_63410 [Streptomyces violascens]GHI40282.1 hypothetical protein Sviol_46900 [Streptomyces violascens]